MKNILLILFSFCASLIYAQGDVPFEKEFFPDQKSELKEAKDNIKEGDKFFSQGEIYFKEAIPYYEKAYAFNPNSSDLNYKLGKCYMNSVNTSKALPVLKSVERLNPNVATDFYYYLGWSQHLAMEWDEAIKSYTKYLAALQNDPNIRKDPMFDLKSVSDNVNNRIKQCYNGKEIIKDPARVFIDNLGDNINTKFNEYGGVISADESVIVFTSRREGTTGGGVDPGINEPFEDLYISYKDENGNWMPAKNLGESVNSKDHDAVCAISPDGQRFIIFLGKKNGGDLYECVLTGDEWSKPESLGKINSDFHEPSAAYAPDGRTLYFVSDKPGGYGEHDIYVSHLDEKGRWTAGVNLGPVINTKFNEDGVFMHPDGKTLYFGSDGHKSIGDMDLFKSTYDAASNTWSEPVNIGYPISTPDRDAFLVLSADGRHGYYTSKAMDSRGLHDIFMVTFLGPEKPMILNNEDNLLASVAAPVKETVIAPKVEVKEAQLTILKGVISDYLTKELLEAEIEIVDNQANTVIATFKSNSKTGKYLVSLPAGKNYGIAVKKEGYLFHSENFDIPKTAAFQEVEKNIELKKLSVGTKIVLRNIFFDLDKATLRPESTVELNRLIKLMNEVPTLKIELGGHTDSRGSDTYNQQLSEKRAKAVVDYLTAHGIDGGRLEWAGYGETQLVNECSNGVKCSDEQHQENRRTEFKVLSL